MQALVNQVRVHGRGPVAEQTGEMMRIPGNAGLDNNIDSATPSLLHQSMVHGPGREQRMQRQQPRLEITVTQHDDELAVADGLLGLLTDLLQRFGQGKVFRLVQVDEGVAVPEHVCAEQLP